MSFPNILMITCHDLGQHLGCYGVETVQSDNLDKLAEKGIRFENYFATASTCSPSRGCIHTGRYPQANGLMGLTHEPWEWKFKPGERHIADMLKEAGYETNLVGFQHVTRDDPRNLGYENVLSRRRDAKETVQTVKGLLDNRKKGDRPFFAKVGFTEVHRPFNKYGIDTEKGVFIPPYMEDTPEIREDLARFQGAIRFMDQCIGDILDSLEKSEVADNTIAIFTSDHGAPYIGAKWTLYDPGIETSLIMYCPGNELQGGKIYTQLMSNVDFLPTLLDIVGVSIPDNVQGHSFKGIIVGDSDKPVRDAVFAQHTSHALRDNLSRCVRTDRYKLIRYFEPGRTVLFPTDAVPQKVADHVERPRRNDKRPVVQLFDLEKDPNEFNDVAQSAEYADVASDLSDRLWNWMEEVEDPLLQGPLPTPYYMEAMQDYHKFRQQKAENL